MKKLTTAILILTFGVIGGASAQDAKLLRYPDISGDSIAFVSGSDLWTVPTSGGTATRITSHPGLEYFPKFSPDGQWIAFTGQYDGDEQVYVIPAAGGEPTQLTYYPARTGGRARGFLDHQVVGWTPDGNSVMFLSFRDSHRGSEPKLFTIPVDGGAATRLPMPRSGAAVYSPDGERLLYSPLYRDFRTWKRYQGGWAQDLWILDIENKDMRNITNHVRTDRDPMWLPGGIYFTSDRDGYLNLYRYDEDSGNAQQLTDFEDQDIRWASDDGTSRIVFELNGNLFIYDTATGAEQAVAVTVPNDNVARRPRDVNVARQVESFNLSPKGERAVMVARGDVFSVPAEHGVTRNLTRTSTAHEREAVWSPDGKSIAYISDITGEDEIWVVPHDGSGPARQITDGHSERLSTLVWSPDSSKIAFSDRDGDIHIADVAAGNSGEVTTSNSGFTRSYTWSPDSRYLAYEKAEPTFFTSIHVWDSESDMSHLVTDSLFNSSSPSWSDDGNYLFYLSAREFSPQIGSFEWNYVMDRETGIYALALSKETPALFPVRNDDPAEEKPKKDGDDKKTDGEETATEIDFEGITGRVERVPMDFDNYGSVTAVEDGLIVSKGGPFYFGRQSDVKSSALKFSFKDRKAEPISADAPSFAISGDGKKILVRNNNRYQLYTLGKKEPDALGTDGLRTRVIPAEEWETMYDEVWRRFRDYFYVENMHGYDWEAIREKYRPLLAHIGHRSDLNYVIGEMIGELNSSHTYIGGGDQNLPDLPRTGLLGARLELDTSAGLYRFSDLLEGQNAEPIYHSPLTGVGTSVDIGDYLLAINGEPLTGNDNPYRLLRGTAGRAVELTVNANPSNEGARKIVIEALNSESNLQYLRWVLKNYRAVEEATDGRIGYLHLPNMSTAGLREFTKWYYGQVRKDGLIIDVRGNGGGNVSQMVMERLLRPLFSLGYVRGERYPRTYPWGRGGNTIFTGKLVTLASENTASDGDTFAWTFQQAEAGPVIGKRTWGGTVGGGFTPLLDGGSVFVPQFALAGPDGQFVVEGHGVDPDIVVENDAGETFQGRDLQLERAIEEALNSIEGTPGILPEKGPGPDRTQ